MRMFLQFQADLILLFLGLLVETASCFQQPRPPALWTPPSSPVLEERDQETRQRLADPRQPMTIPLVLMESAMLPNQSFYFSSSDPKFNLLIRHVLKPTSSKYEAQSFPPCLGIIGLDPTTQHPIRRGVLTEPLSTKQMLFGLDADSNRILGTYFSASSHIFHLVDGQEPWMDPTGSFYLANVWIDPPDTTMNAVQREHTKYMYQQLPELVHQWRELLYQTESLTPAGIQQIFVWAEGTESTIPSKTYKHRAFWVARLLNPVVPLEICRDIRNSLLLCNSDHERLQLVTVALQASIHDLQSNYNNSPHK